MGRCPHNAEYNPRVLFFCPLADEEHPGDRICWFDQENGEHEHCARFWQGEVYRKTGELLRRLHATERLLFQSREAHKSVEMKLATATRALKRLGYVRPVLLTPEQKRERARVHEQKYREAHRDRLRAKGRAYYHAHSGKEM